MRDSKGLFLAMAVALNFAGSAFTLPVTGDQDHVTKKMDALSLAGTGTSIPPSSSFHHQPSSSTQMDLDRVTLASLDKEHQKQSSNTLKEAHSVSSLDQSNKVNAASSSDHDMDHPKSVKSQTKKGRPGLHGQIFHGQMFHGQKLQVGRRLSSVLDPVYGPNTADYEAHNRKMNKLRRVSKRKRSKPY